MRSLLGRFHRPNARSQSDRLFMLNNLGDGSTLSLDFTAMSGLDSRFTFSRTTLGTYVGPDGLLYGADTSTSSQTIGSSGSKTFTLAATAGVDRRYAVGNTVIASSGANNMSGTVTSYDPATQVLVFTATSSSGSGTLATWIIGTRMARFDHDPATLQPRGLLIEGASTNFLNWSESFATSGGTNNNWADTNITRNSTNNTDPANGTTALRVTASAGNGTIISTAAMGTSAQRTLSIWLRRVSGTGNIQYTLDNGSTYTTQAITSSWVRYTFAATTAAQRVGIRIVTSGDSIELWGAMLETGSGASSYISTGASTVQRTADICYIPDGNHSWFTSKNNCVLFLQCEVPRTSNFGNLMYLGQWSGGEYSYGYQVYSFASSTVSINTKITSATSTDQGLFANQPLPIGLKIAVCPNSDAGRFARAWNGTVSETTGLTPTASRFPAWTQQARFGIGTSAESLGSSTACNIYVRTVKFFPFAMSNATLQSLTQ